MSPVPGGRSTTSTSSSGHATPRANCFTAFDTFGPRQIAGEPFAEEEAEADHRQAVRVRAAGSSSRATCARATRHPRCRAGSGGWARRCRRRAARRAIPRARARGRGSPRRCSCRRRLCRRRRRSRGARGRAAPDPPMGRACRPATAARVVGLGGTISTATAVAPSGSSADSMLRSSVASASASRVCTPSRTFTLRVAHVHVLDHAERHEVAREAGVGHAAQCVGDGVGRQRGAAGVDVGVHERGVSSVMEVRCPLAPITGVTVVSFRTRRCGKPISRSASARPAGRGCAAWRRRGCASACAPAARSPPSRRAA